MNQRNSILNFDSNVARIACLCGLFMGLVGSILAQGVGIPDFIQTPVGPVRIGSEVLPVDETEIPDKDHSSAQEEVPRAELTGLIEAQLELQYSVDNQEYDQDGQYVHWLGKFSKAEINSKFLPDGKGYIYNMYTQANLGGDRRQVLYEDFWQALKRMQEDAEKMGANAVVNVRITTSMVMQGASEILAYGTAVTAN